MIKGNEINNEPVETLENEGFEDAYECSCGCPKEPEADMCDDCLRENEEESRWESQQEERWDD